MHKLVAAVALIVLSWIGSHLWKLHHNYRAAKKSGLPILILPLDPQNPLWIIFCVPLRPVLERFTPAPFNDAVKVSIHGWEFRQKTAVHARVGPAFILVTTGLNRLFCADAEMADTILTRRKEFVQFPLTKSVMKVLGENVMCADGTNWSRQRRIVGAALNEKISDLVWSESNKQASEMTDAILALPNGETSQTIHAFRCVALNVLNRIAYAQQKTFELNKNDKQNIDTSTSYTDTVGLVVQFFIVAALLPTWLLCLPVMPSSFQKLGQAMQKVPQLVEDMLNQERQRLNSDNKEPNNILTRLVDLAQEAKEQDVAASEGTTRVFLSDNEISGNLFLFTVAGFETTANTMAFAAVSLAAQPKWQTWLQEELDHVLGSSDNASTQPDYAAVFPKLHRCLAVMLEALRLFPPLPHVSRSTEMPQHVMSGDKSFIIPGPCDVFVNSTCLQVDKAIWGEDASEFNPSRWLTPDSTLENSTLITPAPGTYLPWSGGPRVCPGQKMAQVEFVAVFAEVFRNCTLKPVLRAGESPDQARAKLLDLMANSVHVMALAIEKPEEVNLQWVKR